MFKTPDWEDDVPKIQTSFLKKNEKRKEVKTKVKLPLKVNKAKDKKLQIRNLKQSPKINNIKENKQIQSKTKIININVKTNTTSEVLKLSRKRILDNKVTNTNKKKTKNEGDNVDLLNTYNFDEIIINAKKKKFNDDIENDDKEDVLFLENKSKKKKKKNKNNENTNAVNENGVCNNIEKPINSKKKRLKVMLESVSSRRHINISNKSNQLRERMLERLKAAQFRYLNEKLYTSSGSEAQQLFQNDPTAFETYHQGYQLQVKKWPVNPLDVIVKKIMKMPKTHQIADMGCGEAALSKRIPHTVRSFDLVATAPGVEACDMARTPLLTASMDVTVYCLALMGTDLTQYLLEANRVLKMGGHLLIAEVESRFDNVENFTKEVQRLGFKLKQLDKSNNVFFFMEFTKIGEPPVKKAKLPALTLKPCLYKKR